MVSVSIGVRRGQRGQDGAGGGCYGGCSHFRGRLPPHPENANEAVARRWPQRVYEAHEAFPLEDLVREAVAGLEHENALGAVLSHLVSSWGGGGFRPSVAGVVMKS